MSLINSLLKDLEKRQGHKTLPFIMTRFEKKTNLGILFGKVFLSLFVIISTGFLLIKLVSYPSAIKETPRFTMLEEKYTPALPIDPVWIKPVLITGMTVEVKENITEVTFLLNHTALYRLISNGMNNQLALVLENAEFHNEIPHVSRLETAIEDINSRKIGTGIRFNFTLKSDATLKYVNLNTEKGSPELVLAFETGSAKIISPQESTSTPVIKKAVAQNLLLQQYHLALTAAENQQFHIATEKLYALLEADPYYEEARTTLAAILFSLGKKSEAEKIIDLGLKFAPSHPAFVELKARILTAQGKIKQGLDILQTAIPAMSDNPDYHALMAALYQRNNDDLFAVNIYRKLLSQNPKNSNWWLGLGISLEKINKPKDARNAYSNALSGGNLELASVEYLQKRLKVLANGNDQS